MGTKKENPKKNDNQGTMINAKRDVYMNSKIDNRSGNFYDNQPVESDSRDLREKKQSQKIIIFLSTLNAAIISILCDLISAFLQSKYQIISNNQRTIIVIVLFVVTLLISYLLLLREKQ